MIKSEFVKIKVKGCRKISLFEKLGYDTSKEFIDIKIKDLNSGSRESVDVICDYCGREVKVHYKEYLRNISIRGKYSCSKICGSEKAKETNIKNIGVEYPMMLKSFQEKAKSTNLDKYGVEFLQQSKSIRDKYKITCL